MLFLETTHRSLSKHSRGTFNESVCMCALLNLFKTVIGFIAGVQECPHSYEEKATVCILMSESHYSCLKTYIFDTAYVTYIHYMINTLHIIP